VADLEGEGKPAPPTPAPACATDRRRHGTLGRSTVKDALHNTQNYCHQWLSDSFGVHQIRFRPGLRPDPAGRAYSVPPEPLAGLRGTLLLRKRGRGAEGGEGREEERGCPLTQILGSAPDSGTTGW